MYVVWVVSPCVIICVSRVSARMCVRVLCVVGVCPCRAYGPRASVRVCCVWSVCRVCVCGWVAVCPLVRVDVSLPCVRVYVCLCVSTSAFGWLGVHTYVTSAQHYRDNTHGRVAR